MKITIEGATHEELARSLSELMFRHRYSDDDEGGHDPASSIEARAKALVGEKFDEAVRDGVTAAVAEYTAEKAREVVDSIIVEGVTTTNEYGRARDHKSWREFVLAQLTGNVDPYQSRGRSKVDVLAAECLEALFKDQLKGTLDEIAAKVRAQVDELLAVKIKAAIRQGAGL